MTAFSFGWSVLRLRMVIDSELREFHVGTLVSLTYQKTYIEWTLSPVCSLCTAGTVFDSLFK